MKSRSFASKAACFALLWGATGLGPAAPHRPPPGDEVDLQAWVDGPIRYIARKEEIQAYRKLRKDPDRILFIDRFWARRDPTPESLTNEYRQLFWDRVRQANDNFLDSSKPGWKTDRGKIHILYGPPTKVEEDLHVQTGVGATSGQGLIRWVYEGRPGERKDLDPVVVVAFVRDTGGEYHVSYDPHVTSIFYDPEMLDDPRERAMDRFIRTHGAPARSELSVMLDLGKMQEVPPHARVLIERVETVESYETRDLEANLSRYRHPDGSGTVVVLTVDVTSGGQAEVTPSIVARFAYADDPGREPVLLGEDAFKVEAAGGERLAQGRVVLQPGRYSMTAVLVDPETAATGIERATLEVAPPAPGLALSDVLWAAQLDALPYASLASHEEPFLVGPFRVLPHLGATFRAGEALRLFYEIYGGSLPYRVSYAVQGLEHDGRWVQLGQPAVGEQNGSAQGWELVTAAGWPAGDYRVAIAVEDAGGARVDAVLPFRLDPAEHAHRAD